MKRAVITGIGILSPLGNNPKDFLSAAVAGKCVIRPIHKFDTAAFPVKFGGEIDCSQEEPLSLEQSAEMPTVAQWAVLAARKAVIDADLNLAEEDPFAIDVVVGVSISSMEVLQQEYLDGRGRGMAAAPPEAAVFMNPAAAAIQISRDMGLQGETTNITTACSSSTTAIGYAARLIIHGESSCVITGGADEGITQLFLGAFGNTCLSHRNDEPQRASRPFDRCRDGFVLSDSACIFVLEEYERASARGANIYCEIGGFGSASDAKSAMRIDKSETAGARAIEQAMQRAACAPNEVDYYSAFGISMRSLDARETRMVKRVFKDHARKIAISSIKSMMGHPMGAAGAIQTAACALSIRQGVVFPTINYEEPDPECDLDYVPNQPRAMKIRKAVVYTLGNGGNNAALVLSAC